ncbi:sugar transferase [Seohaeicola saemankumensis]|uniref:sugar transferase n=1 Tax=Seohaeicola saemankumensis TaxID=481181 RepID=UPI001E40359C|nr:sugar transferase [Seohaeicola saemankumensis]
MAYDMGVYSDSVRARATRNVLTSATPRLAAEHAIIYPGLGKRLFDLAFVAAIAVPVAIVMGILALLVASDGRAPFYVQERVGRHGKVFRMYKLRSMVADADQVLAGYLASNPAARAEWDRDQKLKNDPRITRVGRLIRKTSLDELPQFLNVLKGEMSVVGPRPMMCNQKDMYPASEYFEMRPGITGAWQTSARNESSFRERAAYDSDYFYKLSLLTDLKIVLRTFGVVVRATGH